MALESKTLPEFWRRYWKLTPEIRKTARKQFKKLEADPQDREVNLRRKKGKRNVWSADIDFSHRVLGLKQGDTIHWFFIGDHTEYERMLAGMK